MFNKYIGLILSVQALLVVLIVILLRKLNSLEKINKAVRISEQQATTENNEWRVTIPRAIRLGITNAKNIKTLIRQQDVLNRYLVEVLGIGTLLPNVDEIIETGDKIEELRQRVRWHEEVQKKSVDDNNFYKGD